MSMGLKAAQSEPKPLLQVPQFYDEDLIKRCFPIRFRNIGAPQAYLDELGIVPILEFIYKGHLLIEVAEATNVSLTLLRKWIEQNNYYIEVEEAETLSAEGFLAEATRRLRTAPTEFELRRAQAMLKHAQFMAENKNKRIYSGGVEKAPPAQVTYQFNIGQNTPAQQAKEIIEGVVTNTQPKPSISPNAAEPASNTQRMPLLRADSLEALGINKTSERVSLDLSHLETTPVQPQPVLVQDRPHKPTAQIPDTGPFYNDPDDQENEQLPEHYSEQAA